MKKQLVCALLCGALCLTPTLAAGVEEKFPAVAEYPGFADVVTGSWYEAAAITCYEVGLMKGTNLGFEPGKVLSRAECVTIAARIREALTGKAIPGEKASPWYQGHVDYLKADAPADFDWSGLESTATRQDFLDFLALAVAGYEAQFPAINAIEALPDVADGKTVLWFYNAGILTGKDKYGTFDAAGSLSRAEGAAMVARLVREELRLSFTPESYAPFEAAYLTPDTVMFDTGVKADEFLITINNAITAWETTLGEDFNWHYVWTDGKSVLDHVKEDSRSALGVTAKQGTQAYQDFDVQVYYARYISITGETLAPAQGAAV